MATTVAGNPVPLHLPIGREPVSVDVNAKEVMLRNTGLNTLWVSVDDGRTWWDVASGTAWDGRMEVRLVLLRTKVGATTAAVLVTT